MSPVAVNTPASIPLFHIDYIDPWPVPLPPPPSYPPPPSPSSLSTLCYCRDEYLIKYNSIVRLKDVSELFTLQNLKSARFYSQNDGLPHYLRPREVIIFSPGECISVLSLSLSLSLPPTSQPGLASSSVSNSQTSTDSGRSNTTTTFAIFATFAVLTTFATPVTIITAITIRSLHASFKYTCSNPNHHK